MRKVPLVAFEVILENIPEPKAKATRTKPTLELSPFQPVERDFAFLVDRTCGPQTSCARRKAPTAS